MPRSQSILVLGAGELGLAILNAFAHKGAPDTELTVLLRPETADLPRQAPKVAPIYALPGDVRILPCDLVTSSRAELSQAFKPFDVVLGCTGYANNDAVGTQSLQIKIAQAVLDTQSVKLYVPWQWGVDYDQFERGEAGGLFDEQKDVRELLRGATADGQSPTSWLIISTGIFMSFLFQPWWGVVQKDEHNDGWIVDALGSWDKAVTVTTVQDIGKLTVEIVNTALRSESQGGNGDFLLNRAVFIAGDTVRYGDLADTVARATGKPCKRGKVLEAVDLTKAMDDNPDELLNKYRVAFATSDGVSWELSSTFNGPRTVEVTTVGDWAKHHLR